MSTFELRIIEHGEPELWPILGPLMASEEVAKKRGGYPMFSKPGQTWIFAIRDGTVVGFNSVLNGRPARMLYAFAWGDSEVYEAVVRAADSMASPLQSTVLKTNLPVLLGLGFKKVGDKGARYAIVVKGG